MAICPVQVIMDSDQFIADVLLHPGGGRRDFYSGNNEAFAEHRESITNQLNEIYTAQFDSQYSKIGYAKVRLIKTAWAKSHRPTSKLFTRDNDCNVVGGRHQGEMIVRISADGINRLVNGIAANAEDKPRISPGKDGKWQKDPVRGVVKWVLLTRLHRMAQRIGLPLRPLKSLNGLTSMAHVNFPFRYLKLRFLNKKWMDCRLKCEECNLRSWMG